MKTIITTLLILTLFSCTNSNEKNMSGKDTVIRSEKTVFDTATLSKTAEMLNEDKFWEIVDRSLKYRTDQEAQEKFLISEVGQLSPKEMIGFKLRTDKLLYDTYTSEMWCAAYIINGGCSDDGFEYFRCWLISEGKDVYYKAKANPDDLIAEADDNSEYHEFESFWYVAVDAFKNKTGKDLYSYIDNEKFRTNEGSYPPIKFNWEEKKPESMKKICPRLYARFSS